MDPVTIKLYDSDSQYFGDSDDLIAESDYDLEKVFQNPNTWVYNNYQPIFDRGPNVNKIIKGAQLYVAFKFVTKHRQKSIPKNDDLVIKNSAFPYVKEFLDYEESS